MRNNTDKIGFIALSNLKGIGPAFVKKITKDNIFASDNYYEEIKSITSTNNKYFDDFTILDSIEEAKGIVNKCKNNEIKIINLLSDNYPELLRLIKDPPSVLYCKGNIELLYSNIVGIIGTRKTNETGIEISERIGKYFSTSNWTICNGLADGIDNYSIKLNNEINGNVIGVLAGGLNFNHHNTLLKKTAANAQLVLDNGGLLMSEIKPGIKEDNFTIVKSCRIQGGISQGLILIQSALSGGSRYAIKSFCETSRPLGIVEPLAKDCHLPCYEANRKIIENGLKGLSQFVGVKDEKIKIKDISIIKSKDDYKDFENKMANYRPENGIYNPSLFD